MKCLMYMICKELATRLERRSETVVGKFMDGQKEMESRYIQLEEKRLKMEMELEVKQREAERQNELNLWSLMTPVDRTRSIFVQSSDMSSQDNLTLLVLCSHIIELMITDMI